MRPLALNENLTLPAASLDFSASRASGPGGQNVNKVSTKVRLSLDVAEANLPQAAVDRLTSEGQLDRNGRLTVTSQRTATQALNLQDAKDKLLIILSRSLEEPKPRKKTAPSRRVKARNLADKRAHAQKKSSRRAARLVDLGS